jgi:acetyl-CoA acetyltransferase
MATNSLRAEVAIVGIADTAVGVLPGSDANVLCREALRAAVADAGLQLRDVDGLVTFNPVSAPFTYHAEAMAEMLGLQPRYCMTVATGGASTFTAVVQAAAMIAAGHCHTVVVAMADCLRSGLTREQAVAMQASTGHPQFERLWGAPVAAHYALVARAYMAAYGVTAEQLAAVAVSARQHAARHSGAQMRQPLTVAEVLASRMIADPLHALDCSLVSDGGAALVLTRADRARDLLHPPVWLLGAGEGHRHEHLSAAQSLTTTAAVESGQRACAMAGVVPADMDVVGLYDCFTPCVLLQLEDLGFCAKGAAGAFVASGAIAPHGALPVNTHGGLLAHAHCGHPASLFTLTEAVTQLRGTATGRQIKDAELALVHAMGGVLSSHATLILGRERTA